MTCAFRSHILSVAVGLVFLFSTTPAWAADTLETSIHKGPVEATVQLKPAMPLIGDLVTLVLRVVAEENVELLMPEFGQALGRFPILDFQSDERIDDKGRTVVTHRYELQPDRSGRKHIPPIMIEFIDRRDDSIPAPKGFDAFELLTEQISFEVKSVTPGEVKGELHPPLGELPPLHSTQRVTWPIILICFTMILATTLGGWFWIASRRKTRRRSAYDIAVNRLTNLLNHPQEIDSFFVELSAIVRWYLETRFELRAPELTTEEFLVAMSYSPDLSRDHQLVLRDFLRQADLVKFANFLPSQKDIDDATATTQCFLEETRETSPLVNPDHTSSSTKRIAHA